MMFDWQTVHSAACGFMNTASQSSSPSRHGRMALAAGFVALFLSFVCWFAASAGTKPPPGDGAWVDHVPAHWTVKWFTLSFWICAGCSVAWLALAAAQYSLFRWNLSARLWLHLKRSPLPLFLISAVCALLIVLLLSSIPQRPRDPRMLNGRLNESGICPPTTGSSAL
jgi:hypothetical protein